MMISKYMSAFMVAFVVVFAFTAPIAAANVAKVDNTDAVAVIGEQGYKTFAEALTAAKAMTGDVTVEIHEKVTLNTSLSGSYSSITFVGKDTDAEIYLEVQGYITATGKTVNFQDLTLSKSQGGFITNAGFMNTAFGVYDVKAVNYTNCTFSNGAYASSGTVTFTKCIFKRSWDKYGLWAYGDVNCIVDECTFDDYRGIKMYAEGAAKTTELTVKNSNFSAVTDKPAIVLTYGESVNLEANTYSPTGTFELDLDGAPNGVAVTSDVAPTCKNDDGACGVLVDGKIYTTVAQAAAVATSGSTVTLLHNSTETVELPEGVILNKNNFTADGVTVAQPVAKIGEKGYATLQAAIDAVKDGETITLLAECAETITFTQTKDVSFVIDGNNQKMTGSINITARAGKDAASTLVIKNFQFVTDKISHDFIKSVETNYYPNNITIENCSFIGTADIASAGYAVVAVRLKSANNILVKDCTGSGLHSFLQNTAGWNVNLDNVDVTDSLGGFAMGTVQGTTIKNCDLDVETMGIRLDAQYDNNAEITDCKVTAFIPVVVRKASVDGTLTFSGSNTMTAENTDGLWCAIGTVEYKENGTMPTAPTGKVVVTLNDANLPASGVYGNYAVAVVNGVKYVTLKDAVAAVADGGVIMLIANETFTEANRTSSGGSWYEGLYYVGDKSFTINLNGFTITQNGAVNDYLMLFKNEGSKANAITLQNGTMDAGSTAYCAICTSSASTQKIIVNLENVNVIGNNSNGSVLKIRGGTELNVKAGTKITGKNSYLGIECVASTVNIYDGAEIYMNGTDSYNGCLVGACGGGVVNVYGGYGKGVKGGFIAMTSGGSINVFGGEWIANNDGTVGNNSNFYVLTAQNNKNESGYVGASVINVTGGIFRGGMDAWVLNDTTVEKAELNIAGGNFNANPTAYLDEGYVVNEVSGVYTVAKAVAKIGAGYYTNLVDAFKAATEGCTIEILSDVTIDYKWDCRDYATGGSHSQFKESVTINGNGHTLKFTGTVNDSNWNTIFRFEENATVNNLTVDISEATGAQRVISAKKSLTVDGITVVGSAKYGIIFGEGASAADLAAAEIVVKNSTLTGTRRAISDNEGGKDVKSVAITDNTLNANVYASASESITFNNNTAAGEVDLRSYTAENVLSVEAKGNTLNAGVKNYIYAKNIDAQEGFTAERVPTTVSTYEQLIAALAEDNAYVVLANDITATATQSSGYGKAGIVVEAGDVLDGNGKTLTINGANATWDCAIAMRGGEVKNLTIAGAMRGVFMPDANGDVVIDNCKFQDVIYTFNSDAGSKDYTVTIKNTELNGWTSFSDVHKAVVFDTCTFAKGNGYAYCRPYQATTFKDCSFSDDYAFDCSKVADNELAFNECTYNGQAITSENAFDLFGDGAKVLVNSVPVNYTKVAKIGDSYYATLQAALDAAAAGTGNVTVEILSDIDLTGTAWNPVTVSASGYPFVTVNGNNKTIKGLNDMLFAGTWAGKSGLVINDLTIADSTIVNDENDSKGTVGVGAFIGYPQASETITLNNCHLKNSTVKGGHWTGGLIGMAGGYSGNDGPVFMTLTIDGCSVTDSTITGKGSAGGIIGHGSCSAWTDVIIVNSTVSDNTITSTGSSNNKAGSVMGTIGAAGQPTTVNGVTKTGGMSVSVTTAGNTVKSADKVITTIYGRQGTETGLLEIAGGTYEAYPIEENVEYAAPKDGYIIFENADGKYGVKEGTYVAQINGVKYETLASALAAAQNDAVVELLWAEGNAPIAMNGSVYGNKTVTITGTAEVDWSKGWLFVGRGGVGNGTVIFDNANLESASDNASTGIHVSGREKDTNNKYDGTVVINNSTIELDYLIDKGAITMTNSTLTVKNGFAVGGRPAHETESGADATATFDLTNGSTLIVNNHNGQGLGYEAIGIMNIDGTSTFKCTQSFLVTGKGALNVAKGGKVEFTGAVKTLTVNGALASAGDVFADIVAGENADIEISGGVYTQDVNEWCVEGHVALKNFSDKYVVGVAPTATIENLGATVVPAGEWKDTSFREGEEDMPLPFVMKYVADESAEAGAASPYAEWYGDFVISFEGLANGKFSTEGCYLAGYYGSFGWVKVPVDGLMDTIEEGVRYPVMLGVNPSWGQKYEYICSGVDTFLCAMYLPESVLEANPNLKVKLELCVVDNSAGGSAAQQALATTDSPYAYQSAVKEFGAQDFIDVELPEVEVVDIKDTLTDSDPDLTFALNFAIKDSDKLTEAYLEKLFAKYGDYYTDYVLTISGLSQESVTFNANGDADGYLAGQYDKWSENWVSVPFDDVTVENGQSLYIMEYAAKLMNKQGLRFTLREVAEIVQNFDCGVYFTPEFLAANPDLKVDLELKVFTEDESGNKINDISVATNEFDKDDFGVAAVVAEDKQTRYFASLADAVAAADADDTVMLLADISSDDTLTISEDITVDLNGKTVSGNFIVKAGATVEIKSGKIDNDNNSVSAIQSFGNLTLTDVEAESARHVVRVEGGKTVINGGIYKVTPESAMTLHTVNVSDGGEVEINGGKFVGPNGTIADSGSAVNIQAGSKGTINGGNFSGGKLNTLASSAALTVMGGIYDQDPAKYLPAGYATYMEGAGFGVMKCIILDIKVVDSKPVIGYAESDTVDGGALILKATSTLDGTVTWTTITWTKDGELSTADTVKDWVKPAGDYRFFTGGVIK